MYRLLKFISLFLVEFRMKFTLICEGTKKKEKKENEIVTKLNFNC